MKLVERSTDVEALFVRRGADGAFKLEASDGFPKLDAPP